MNRAQIDSLVRAIVIAVGGIAVGLGWLSKDSLDQASDPETVAAVVGALSVLGATLWGLYSRRNAGLVASTAELDAVQTITANRKIADEVPSAKVQPR